MKKKLYLKMLAMAMAAGLMFGSNSLTALAAEFTPGIDNGHEVDMPKGETEGGTKSSSGAATAGRDPASDENFKVVGDDDNTDAEGEDTTADISIWAKVVEHGSIVYKVDIAWGAMKFEFNNQTGKWNTQTHEYDTEEESATAEWTVDNFIDAENNKIEVVNHSNAAVDTEFDYSHDAEGEASAFNAVLGSDNAVRGHFFLDNADAVTASKVLANSADVENSLTDALTLGHQDLTNELHYGGDVAENEDGSHTRYVYFTFNGTPDEEAIGEDLKTDFTKVGVITVTISPTVETQDEP